VLFAILPRCGIIGPAFGGRYSSPKEVSLKYEVVIGIEVHAQLLTSTKMFCGCRVDRASAPPNTTACPVCLGMPGVLPVMNDLALEYAIMTSLALHCTLGHVSRFDRKNYPYPDLPKGYQISQYDMPIAQNGWLQIEVDGQVRRIGIQRVHLEEDTARLVHEGGHSLVDFNRAGVPLLEIVSQPTIHSPEEARQYLGKLRTILRYLGASTGNMEEGAMRCEPNISLRPVGGVEHGTKVEVKNLNSLRSAKRALQYEVERQTALLEAGEAVEQVTVGWDENRGRTVFQRGKESAHDYRYFPEPDLPPLVFERDWIADLRDRIPELPDEKRERLAQEYGLSPYDAALLTEDRGVADFFESALSYAAKMTDGGEASAPSPKSVCNWIIGELFRLMKAEGRDVRDVIVKPEHMVDLIVMVNRGQINATVAKSVFEEMFATGHEADRIVADKGLTEISDEEKLDQVIEAVLDEHSGPVAQYLDGKETVLRFLMGQVMRATRGQANHEIVDRLLKQRLELRRE
jgi:aspartyl-tRNA(Asn)/glutamyl-tRNA(Gln) amidotransferase subunit B